MSINSTEEKSFQYADDTNPIISDDNSLNELFKELVINQKAIDSKVNMAKTKKKSGQENGRTRQTNLSILIGKMKKLKV